MKKVIIIILSICLTHFLFAQSNPFTGSLLWKVEGNNLDKPSYIMGTFHLFPGSYIEEVPGLNEAMNSVDQIIGEIDLLDQAASQAMMTEASILPPDQSYGTLLSEDEYNQLDEGLKNYMGMGLDQLGGVKPGILSPMIAMMLYMKIDPGFNPTAFEPLDAVIQFKSNDAGKKITALETLKEQIHFLLDAQPQQWQMKSLLCTLSNMDGMAEAFVKLVNDYKVGNLDEIYNDSFVNEEDPCLSFTQESKPVILDNRNKKWLEKLPQMMQDDSSLIVVGALHLAGEEGLLYQLDKMGYTVTAVK